MNPFTTITDAISELKKGNMLIVLDSPDRENQADIIFPAQTVTPEKINFIQLHCRGMICAPITQEIADHLSLPLMVPLSKNTEDTTVNFTITIDAKNVTSHGISASDRALTIKQIANPASSPLDFVRPGHVFPLLSRPGGVLERPGHTEATTDLMRLAGLYPAGVLSEILNDSGEVADLSQLKKFSSIHNIKMISIEDLIKHIKNN